MNKIEQLIADYKKEYERVNGRVPAITRTSAKSLWIEIDRNFFRIGEVRNALTVLRGRANFYPVGNFTAAQPNEATV